MTTDNTARDGHIEALRELRVGVEMDAAQDPSGAAKLAALDAAIAALAPAEAVAWIEPGHLREQRECSARAGYGMPLVASTAPRAPNCIPLFAAPQQEARVVDEAMVDRALHAARDASDARLPRYSVIRAALTAALTGSSHDA